MDFGPPGGDAGGHPATGWGGGGGGCIYSACPAPLPDALADEVWVCFYGVCVIFGAKFRGYPRPGAHLELQAGSETLWGAQGRLLDVFWWILVSNAGFLGAHFQHFSNMFS